MRDQARRRGGEVELWGLTGLLHDLDYERYPDPETGHPRMAMAELERRGYRPELIRGVATHADYLGVPRETEMELALAAVDELSGFLLACAYVRPEGLHGMTARSVRKKLRQPSFAAAVSREELERGAAALGLELDELIEQAIAALTPLAAELGAAASGVRPLPGPNNFSRFPVKWRCWPIAAAVRSTAPRHIRGGRGRGP